MTEVGLESESPIASPEQNRRSVFSPCHQVELPVAVEIGRHERRGGEVVVYVRIDECSAGLLKGPVPPSSEKCYFIRASQDHRIQHAVLIEISDDDGPESVAYRCIRIKARERSVALAEQGRNGCGIILRAVVTQRDQVDLSVSIEITAGERNGVFAHGNGGLAAKSTVAVSQQNGNRGVVLIDYGQVDSAVRIEIPGHHAHRIIASRVLHLPPKCAVTVTQQ